MKVRDQRQTSTSSFGAYGVGYLRFSYANSYENLMEALERIGGCLR